MRARLVRRGALVDRADWPVSAPNWNLRRQRNGPDRRAPRELSEGNARHSSRHPRHASTSSSAGKSSAFPQRFDQEQWPGFPLHSGRLQVHSQPAWSWAALRERAGTQGQRRRRELRSGDEQSRGQGGHPAAVRLVGDAQRDRVRYRRPIAPASREDSGRQLSRLGARVDEFEEHDEPAETAAEEKGPTGRLGGAERRRRGLDRAGRDRSAALLAVEGRQGGSPPAVGRCRRGRKPETAGGALPRGLLQEQFETAAGGGSGSGREAMEAEQRRAVAVQQESRVQQEAFVRPVPAAHAVRALPRARVRQDDRRSGRLRRAVLRGRVPLPPERPPQRDEPRDHPDPRALSAAGPSAPGLLRAHAARPHDRHLLARRAQPRPQEIPQHDHQGLRLSLTAPTALPLDRLYRTFDII